MALIKESGPIVPSTSTFTETMLTIGSQFPIEKVFRDFLTMTIAACTKNARTNQSYYEQEYVQIINQYKSSGLHKSFPDAFAWLAVEMAQRSGSTQGNDVLGEFYELHVLKQPIGSLFAPYADCLLMASIANAVVGEVYHNPKQPLQIIDPACRSGRMIMAGRDVHGDGYRFHGIDIDHTCVKMAAINLFLNGIRDCEIMCANIETPRDFVIAYHVSSQPFGIFKIEEKEKSQVWRRAAALFS